VCVFQREKAIRDGRWNVDQASDIRTAAEIRTPRCLRDDPADPKQRLRVFPA